mmetsp:Transcript_12694/g.41858  ORF Transcript_12694/g.41858 Transcript_12694/m.41858 type:complete len:200 (+) Transcript_12694:2778-3377(+)
MCHLRRSYWCSLEEPSKARPRGHPPAHENLARSRVATLHRCDWMMSPEPASMHHTTMSALRDRVVRRYHSTWTCLDSLMMETHLLREPRRTCALSRLATGGWRSRAPDRSHRHRLCRTRLASRWTCGGCATVRRCGLVPFRPRRRVRAGDLQIFARGRLEKIPKFSKVAKTQLRAPRCLGSPFAGHPQLHRCHLSSPSP